MTSKQDDIYEIECYEQKMQIRELINKEVREGDGALSNKAKHVLEVGARHIAEGRPSKVFLDFVAHSIERTLKGEEKSLDKAFRLVVSGRPKKDPYADSAIKAALAHMVEFEEIESGTGNSAGQEKRRRAARSLAVDVAYKVRHRKTPQEHRDKGLNLETIKARREVIRTELKTMVRYTSLDGRGK